MFNTTRQSLSSEKKLVRKLLNNYARIGRVGRPVRNVSTSVPVHFGLGLIQMSLDEKNKILSMSMWTRYVRLRFIFIAYRMEKGSYMLVHMTIIRDDMLQ